MAGYEDTKQKIISTLMGRPVGTEIQPENHQDYALNMLDYIRSLELIATSTLIGVAESNTTPVQPNSSRVCYIAGVAQSQTVVFENFIDENGNPISVTTGDTEGVFVILMWNTQYWSAQTFSTNIISHSESATFYYRYNIRKTYASIALMNSDVASPIGTDGKYIKIGDIVTVVNSTTPSENGIYSYEGATDGWKYQSSFNFQLEQIRSQNTNTAPSSKLFDDKINELASNIVQVETNLNVYNVTTQNPLAAGVYYTKATARAAVPTVSRKLGLVITYATADKVWYSEKYIGTTVAGWTTEANWEQVPDAARVAALETDLNAKVPILKITGEPIGIYNIKDNYYLNASGVEVSFGGYYYDQTYYPVMSGMKLTKTGANLTSTTPVIFYDESKNVVGVLSGNAPLSIVIPEGVAYIRLNLGTNKSGYGCVFSEDYSIWNNVNNSLKKIGSETVNGVKTFVASPVVPIATTHLQAQNKSGVELQIIERTNKVLSSMFRGEIGATPYQLFDGNTWGWYNNKSVVADANGRVSSWFDILGSGHDLKQAVEAKQPIFNGTEIISDGVDDFLKTDKFVLLKPVTIYIVAEFNNSNSHVILDGYNANHIGITCTLSNSTHTIKQYSNFAGAAETNYLGKNELGCINAVFDISATIIGINNRPESVGTISPIYDFNGAITLFATASGVSPAKFKVRELIVRNTVDDLETRKLFSYYLCDKHKILYKKNHTYEPYNNEINPVLDSQLILYPDLSNTFTSGVNDMFTKVGNPTVSEETIDVVSGKSQRFMATAQNDGLRMSIPLYSGNIVRIRVVAKRISGTSGNVVIAPFLKRYANNIPITSSEFQTYEIYGYVNDNTYEVSTLMLYVVKEIGTADFDEVIIDSVSVEKINLNSTLSKGYFSTPDSDFQIICYPELNDNSMIGFLFNVDNIINPNKCIGVMLTKDALIGGTNIMGKQSGYMIPYAWSNGKEIRIRKTGGNVDVLIDDVRYLFPMQTITDTNIIYNKNHFMLSASPLSKINNIEILRKKKRITFIGDSIVAQSDGWSYLFTNKYKKDGSYLYATNRAVFGATIRTGAASSWMAQQIADSVNDNPDIVVVGLGTNDQGSAEDITALYKANLLQIKTYHPKAKIYCLGVLNNLLGDEARTLINSRIKAAADSVSYVTYINTDQWVDVTTDLVDGAHLNASGNKKVSEELLMLI